MKLNCLTRDYYTLFTQKGIFRNNRNHWDYKKLSPKSCYFEKTASFRAD